MMGNLKNMKNTEISVFELWDELDQTVFTSTHERKCLGFALFQKLVEKISSEDVVLIFTPNFLRCLINNLSNKETYLNKVAKDTAEKISLKSQESPEIAFKIVLQIIGPYGSLNFDSISKTKTVENILNNLTSDGVHKYVTHLSNLFVNQGTQDGPDNQKGPEIVRQRFLDLLFAIFKIPKIPKEEKWIKDILQLLCTHGFFKCKDAAESKNEQPVPPISQKTLEYCRSKLDSILGSLHSILLNGRKGTILININQRAKISWSNA